MIKELLSNLAILTSLIFFYINFAKKVPISKASSVKGKVLLGVLGGLLSNILMLYGMKFGNTIIDLRNIPIVLTSYYGGGLPAIIAMGLVIIGRLSIGLNTSSYLGVLLIVLTTLASIYISDKRMTKRIKILLSLSVSNFIFSVIISYVFKDIKILLVLLLAYWSISYLAGFISFYMVEYLRSSQKLFNQYKSEAVTDGLTGLNNVRKFDEVYNSILKEAETKNESLSLLYIDIDFFKKINDTYGHKEGDLVLKELASLLNKCVRSFDIVSRNGGEEFTVILLDCPANRAKEISETIRKTVETHPFKLSTGKVIHISISIGVACFNQTTTNSASLIEDADKALYQAKRSGRNVVCFSGQGDRFPVPL